MQSTYIELSPKTNKNKKEKKKKKKNRKRKKKKEKEEGLLIEQRNLIYIRKYSTLLTHKYIHTFSTSTVHTVHMIAIPPHHRTAPYLPTYSTSIYTQKKTIIEILQSIYIYILYTDYYTSNDFTFRRSDHVTGCRVLACWHMPTIP